MDDDAISSGAGEVPPRPSEVTPESTATEQPVDANPMPPNKRGGRGPLAIGLLFVVVAGLVGIAIGAFMLLRGTGDSVIAMVPGDAGYYATVYLDPSAGQKLNLYNLLGRFPGTKDSAAREKLVNDGFDQALKGTGLDHNDVRPWLGNQVAVMGRIGSGTFPVAAYVATKDDGQALATADKLRKGPQGQKDNWTQQSHDGVNVWVGSKNGAEQEAYTLVKHNLVIGSNSTAVNDVIDAAQGKRASLEGNQQYKRALSNLPTDRFGVAYVDAHAALGTLTDTLGSSSGGSGTSAQLGKALQQLGAFQGAGMALSAQSTGIALDTTVTYDSSKLTSAERASLQLPPHANGVTSFVPKTSYGFVGLTGLRQTITQVADTLGGQGTTSSVSSVLDGVGLTGAQGIVNHLGGDWGVEVGPATGAVPVAGAILLATDDENAMGQFLDRLAALAGQLQGSTGQPDAAGGQPGAVNNSYHGVSYRTLAMPGLPAEIRPTYAVTGGMGIVASSEVEMKAIIDAHSGANVTTAAHYRDALAQVSGSNNGQMYVDTASLLPLLDGLMSGNSAQQYHSQVRPNLDPVKSVIMTTTGGSTDHTNSRLFFLIP